MRNRLYIAMLALAPCLAAAQGFPSKPVQLLVPFSPGVANDVLARTLALELKEDHGAVVVENKARAPRGTRCSSRRTPS